MPDARKGERLILVTQQKDATRARVPGLRQASKRASDLMMPAEVLVLDKLPMLGSGKVDIMAAAKLVKERLAAKPDAMARAMG